jgi:phage gp16-like protein
MQQDIEKPLETREEVLEEFARKGRMTRNRGIRIGASKISLVHIAKTQLGMDDEAYRAMQSRVICVQSYRDLDERSFVAVMREFERYGFMREAVPVRRVARREGRSTEAQWRNMETLAKMVSYDGLLEPRVVHWMKARGKVSHRQFLDPSGAQSVIAALTKWSRRKARNTTRNS